MPYNITPAPLKGIGAFGEVPGTLSMPNPASDLGGQLPGLPGLNQAAGDTIGAQLGGSISPATMRALQNASATFGLTSGMPGLPKNGLAMNNLFGNIAGFAEGQANKGLANYNQLIPTISNTQTVNPALQTHIAEQNALSLAAPSPAAAASHAEQLFQKYLNGLRGGGGGGGIGGALGRGGGGARDLLGFPIGETTPSGGEGTIVAGAGGVLPGSRFAGAGGVMPSSTGNPWENDFWSQFDTGTDVSAGNPWAQGYNPYTAGGLPSTTNPQGQSEEDFWSNFDTGTDVGGGG